MKTNNIAIVEAVRKGIASRNEVIENIYRDENLKNSIVSFVTKNSGSMEEGNDAFTFAIVTFIQQCYRPHFQLNKDLNAYLFSIAKYEWYRLARKKAKMVSSSQSADFPTDFDIELDLIDKEKHHALKEALLKLDSKCREVLKLWANSVRMREIAITMSYKSEGMARKKKYECIKKMRLLIEDI